MENKINKEETKYIKLSIVLIILIFVSIFFVKDIILPEQDNNDSYAILLNTGDIYYLNDNEQELNWLSSDKTIANVDENGIVRGNSEGLVTITAYDNEEKVYEYVIKIVNNNITGLTLKEKEITLEINSTYKLNLYVELEDYDVTKLSWSSSNNDVVMVDNGTIKALKEGSSIITVVNENSQSSTCKVTVEENKTKEESSHSQSSNKIEKISFKENYKKLYIGDSHQTKIIVTPSNIEAKISYKSKNNKIATVSNSGQITAISEGKTEIIATHEGLTTSFNVEVIKNNKKTVTISFDSNGSDKISAKKERCTYSSDGCKITLPTIKRAGYKVLGWSRDRTATDIEYKPGEKITVYGDTTYYAITYKTLTANFNANGSVVADNKKTCKIYNEDTSCTIKTPSITRNGYNIIGWSNEATSKTKTVNVNANVQIKNNINYYAVTSKKLTASFNSNGSVVTENKKTCTIYNNETSCNIKTPQITRNGYNIVGWSNSSSDTTMKEQVGKSISIKKDVSYYAITYKTITATFDANNTIISKDKASCNIYNLSTSCVVETPTITKTNYTPVGWTTSKGSSNVVAAPKSKLSISKNATYYPITRIAVDGVEAGCTGWMAINGYYYSSPKTSSSKTKISVGTAFTIEGVNGSFFKVSIPNVSGYKYIEHKYIMINLSDYIPSMVFEITNASSSIYKTSGYNLEGVTGTKLYAAGKVYNARLGKKEYMAPILYTVAKKLLVAQKNLQSQGYLIKVYDTYRPHSISKKIYNSLNTLYNNNKIVKENILYSYGASGKRYTWSKSWFLSSTVSKHNTGSAIDMTLVNKNTGIEVTMPTVMHELSTKSIKYYSPDVSKKPANYSKEMNDIAKLMDKAVTNAGLTSLASEWWHFQDTNAHNLIKNNQVNGCDFSVTKVYSY